MVAIVPRRLNALTIEVADDTTWTLFNDIFEGHDVEIYSPSSTTTRVSKYIKELRKGTNDRLDFGRRVILTDLRDT